MTEPGNACISSQTTCPIADRRRTRPGQRQPAAGFFVVVAFGLSAPVLVPVLGCNSFPPQATAEPVGRLERLEQAAGCDLQSVTREDLVAVLS